MNKPCKKCGSERLTKFWGGKTHYVCVACEQKRDQTRRENRKAYHRAYTAKWYRRRNPPKKRVANLTSKTAKPWYVTRPIVYRAHKTVEYHVASGKLKRQPCERCGSENTHAHHEDYSKPLEVMWLCPLHHVARHKELKLLARANDLRIVATTGDAEPPN